MTSRVEYDRISPDFEPYELTIDGRDLAYRDPNNPAKQDHIIDSRSTNRDIYGNEDAYNMTNPLYDYSYGEMQRAGEALGIRNINDKEEVERMLEYMSKPSAMEAAKDEQIEEAVEPSSTPLTDEFAQKEAPLSKEAQESQDFLNEYVSSIKDGSFNDGYRKPTTGAGATFGRKALDTQIANATTGIDINNFTKQREEMSKLIQDEFTRKLYSDNEFRFNSVA